MSDRPEALPEPGQITRLLAEARDGNAVSREQLIGLVYHELHRIAQRRLRGERSDHTLQPTALVNEAYIRLLGSAERDWQNRAQFFGFAAQVMRHILVDYARNHRAAKRGAGAHKVSLDEVMAVSSDRTDEILRLDEALEKLAQWDERQSRIVELRVLVGLTDEEIAEALGISVRTVKRDWSVARAWLYGEFSASAG
jgi:RNA polymerase sigma factor (TIGR02999 family)